MNPDRRELLLWLAGVSLVLAVSPGHAAGKGKGGGKGGGRGGSGGGDSGAASGDSGGGGGSSSSSGGGGESSDTAGGSISDTGGDESSPGDPAGTDGGATPDVGASAPGEEEETDVPADGATGEGELDQEAALEAVQRGDALPFRAVRREIEQKYRGEIIDATLQRTRRGLVYRLKILSRGRVFSVSVDADTGRPGRAFGLPCVFC